MKSQLMCNFAEYPGSAPVASRKDTTQMTAAAPPVAKRKRAIRDTNSELQEPTSKALKNEPIDGSSLDTIDLCDDENDDKNEDDYDSDTDRMQSDLPQHNDHPPILPKIIDLEEPVKDEAERSSVAPPVMLSSNQNSTTDLNFIAFPITFPAGTVTAQIPD